MCAGRSFFRILLACDESSSNGHLQRRSSIECNGLSFSSGSVWPACALVPDVVDRLPFCRYGPLGAEESVWMWRISDGGLSVLMAVILCAADVLKAHHSFFSLWIIADGEGGKGRKEETCHCGCQCPFNRLHCLRGSARLPPPKERVRACRLCGAVQRSAGGPVNAYMHMLPFVFCRTCLAECPLACVVHRVSRSVRRCVGLPKIE